MRGARAAAVTPGRPLPCLLPRPRSPPPSSPSSTSSTPHQTQALGKGSYGSVYKVKRKQDNQFYAIKEVNIKKLQPKEREDAVNEIRIMASIKHKNIVRYCDAFLERDNLYIAMEFAEHGDISRQIDKFKAANKYIKEDTIWSYFIQMCNGLSLMHGRNVLHRDLKPKNIFLTGKNHIRLGDLGCAKFMKSGMARTQIGAFATLQHTQKRIRAHCRRLPVSFLFCINISLRAPYA